ncbi:MAG: AlpA family phage regulatory protein [Gammaproteobacteria bacterium]|nr:AlpA family phage regulatory protein [Gammaproteobacteria bacterium]
MSNERILRWPEVHKRTGICRSNAYKLINEDKFPPPIKLGKRASGWIQSEIEKWIEDRINQSRQST